MVSINHAMILPLLRKLGPLVHILHCSSRDVHVMPLTSSGLSAGLVNGLYTIEETVTPAHEGLRVDIFVILHESPGHPGAPRRRPPRNCGRKDQVRLGVAPSSGRPYLSRYSRSMTKLHAAGLERSSHSAAGIRISSRRKLFRALKAETYQ